MLFSAFDGTFLAMAAPFLAAIFAPAVRWLAGRYIGYILALVPALTALHFAQFLPGIAGNQAFVGGFDWAWQLNVRFSYLIDGLSLMFVLLITLLGTIIVISAADGLNGHPRQDRFYSLLFLLMGSALGLVLADDLLMLFVFWEMTAITGCLLVGFKCQQKAARRAAWLTLVVPVAGGLPLLAGLLMLIGFLGVPSMSDAIALGNTFGEHPAYLSVLVLVLAGAFTKSAQFPFQFWLPRVAVAPAPAAAYLQSATMAPAGIYLLMRVHPFLGDTPAWSIIVPVTGGLTLLIGAIKAFQQNELRALLAHISVAIFGLVVMLLGTSLSLAILASCAFLLAHALAMSALVLATGLIAARTGASEVSHLRGLARTMPTAFAAMALAALTLAGVPNTAGFWATTLAQDALFIDNPLALTLLALLAASMALIAALAFALAFTPLFGPKKETAKPASAGSPGVWFGVVLLSLGTIAMITFGAWTGKYLLDPAHLAIALRLGEVGDPPGIQLDAVFAISAAIWGIGAVLCWARWGRRFRRPGWCARAETVIGYAGAIVVAGVSLWALIRLSPTMMPDTGRRSVLAAEGLAIVAMIAAPVAALIRPGRRRLFACLVAGGAGLVTAGLAIGSPIGLAGALAFAIQFPIAMAGLVLTMAVAHRTGEATGSDRQINGDNIVLAALALVFILSLSGLPPFSGFWPRVLLTQAAFLDARWWLAIAILLCGPLTLIASVRTIAQLRGTGQLTGMPVENPPNRARLRIFGPPIVLAVPAFLLGVWPAVVMPIVDRSVAAFLGP